MSATAPCQHKRGEHNDTYRHCLDCGCEWVLISGEWFPVEAWVRVSTKLLEESDDAIRLRLGQAMSAQGRG